MNIKDESLRWRLRGLRQDVEPGQDLWPGIAARIGALPQPSPVPLRSRPLRRFMPWATAASVLLTVGFAWQAMRMPTMQEPLIEREAALLTRDYQGALSQFQGVEEHPELGGALQELDRSAAQIRQALAHDPDARFLLEQLRRTYAKRLALTQRAVMS